MSHPAPAVRREAGMSGEQKLSSCTPETPKYQASKCAFEMKARPKTTDPSCGTATPVEISPATSGVTVTDGQQSVLTRSQTKKTTHTTPMFSQQNLQHKVLTGNPLPVKSYTDADIADLMSGLVIEPEVSNSDNDSDEVSELGDTYVCEYLLDPLVSNENGSDEVSELGDTYVHECFLNEHKCDKNCIMLAEENERLKAECYLLSIRSQWSEAIKQNWDAKASTVVYNECFVRHKEAVNDEANDLSTFCDEMNELTACAPVDNTGEISVLQRELDTLRMEVYSRRVLDSMEL